MNAIHKPVYRPTADCIWNAFLSSRKRHLFLTGSRQIGKTTLLTALESRLEKELALPSPCPGVTTWAVPKQGVFLRENPSHSQTQIGVYDPSLPGLSQKMRPCPAGFQELGIPALTRCLEAPDPWICLDEIGYLETAVPAYQEALEALLEKKQILASVRRQELPFLQALCSREDVCCIDLDDPFGSCGCVIMASGLGRRFGGNKLMVPFRGRPLLQGVLDATEGIFKKRVVVTRHQEVAKLCGKQGIFTVLHEKPFRSDTIRLGLSAVGDVAGCMFCPGDQPLLRQETAAALCLAARQEPEAIWRPACGQTAGSPVLFPSWTFPELNALSQNQGGGQLMKQYPQRMRYVNVRDMAELMDVDCPADLQNLSQRQTEFSYRQR